MSAFPASSVRFLIDVVVRRYGLTAREMRVAGGLHHDELSDPSGMVALDAFERVLRFVLQRTGDPALGMRWAQDHDLRSQGFWGYALMSSTTVGERLARNARYAALRGPLASSLSVVGDTAHADVVLHGFSVDLEPVLLDTIVVSGVAALGRQLGAPLRALCITLTQPERPHHRELRAMIPGPITFGAGRNRLSFAAADLARPLAGDPYLGQLATTQLEAQLEALKARQPPTQVARVRERIAVRLHDDASLERIAADLEVSARTLQRTLDAHGASFQDLLNDARRARATAYLVQTDEPTERIAALLGYADPSAFRRAFLRWTGCTPAAFRAARAKERKGLPDVAAEASPSAPARSEGAG